MPSDDDFVHNYMVCVHTASLQQKTCKNSQFQQIKHFVKVKLKPYYTHGVYMHAYVDTGADVNLMPQDMYIKLYNDDNLKHLKPSDIKLGVWGDNQIALLGKCNMYLTHPDTKKSVEVTFYVADKSGSTLLSCATSLKLDLIKLHPKLGVSPPRAKIITSQADRASPAAKRITQGKVVFDEMSSLVLRSVPYDHPVWPPFKPLTAPFKNPLQPHAGALFEGEPSVIEKQARYQNDQHDETSLKVPKSAPYDCPMQALCKPHMAPFRNPLQPCAGAPFKGEPSVVERRARYQKDQHDKLSPIVPRSVPYNCSMWPPFKPLTALFSPIQPCTGVPFKREPVAIQKPDKYQNDQHDKLSSLASKSAPYECSEHSDHSTIQFGCSTI